MFRLGGNLSRASRIGAAAKSVGSFDLIMSILLKLTSLAIRTVAKPIGTMIKLQAKEHVAFRKACVQLAQNLHQIDVKLKIKLLGQKNIKVRPLNENKAIENGANIISESFIFGVAGSLIFYESYRQRKKELGRREAVADDISMLQDEIEFLKGNLSKYLKVEDYKPTKQYHPTILKVDHANESPLESPKNSTISLILTKLDHDELASFGKNDKLKILDKQIFEEDKKSNVLYLKLEKLGE